MNPLLWVLLGGSGLWAFSKLVSPKNDSADIDAAVAAALAQEKDVEYMHSFAQKLRAAGRDAQADSIDARAVHMSGVSALPLTSHIYGGIGSASSVMTRAT